MLVIGTCCIIFGPNANSQVVISLLFGDKLNSESVKFGLDGGINYSNLSNANSSDNQSGFNLGFYFDIQLKEHSNWYLHGPFAQITDGGRWPGTIYTEQPGTGFDL